MVVQKPYTATKPEPTGTANYCPQAFNAYFSAETWSSAVRGALGHARGHPWVDARRTLVLGFSEGALIASMLAGAEPTVSHVALLGALGPTQYFDFVAGAYRDASTDEERRDKLLALEAQRQKIDAAPDSSTDFAWGHPYKRWSSFFKISSIQHLAASQARVYIVSGMQDRNVPILSTEVLASELLAAGRDVTLRRLPGAGHSLVGEGRPWSDADPEYDRILDWFDRAREAGGR